METILTLVVLGGALHYLCKRRPRESRLERVKHPHHINDDSGAIMPQIKSDHIGGYTNTLISSAGGANFLHSPHFQKKRKALRDEAHL